MDHPGAEPTSTAQYQHKRAGAGNTPAKNDPFSTSSQEPNPVDFSAGGADTLESVKVTHHQFDAVSATNQLHFGSESLMGFCGEMSSEGESRRNEQSHLVEEEQGSDDDDGEQEEN